MSDTETAPPAPIAKVEAPAENPEVMTIVVRDQNGTETHFRVKKATKMKKVMDAYAKRSGLQPNSFKFLVDGDRITEDDTPESLDLEDKDQIDCMLHQIGGF